MLPLPEQFETFRTFERFLGSAQLAFISANNRGTLAILDRPEAGGHGLLLGPRQERVHGAEEDDEDTVGPGRLPPSNVYTLLK